MRITHPDFVVEPIDHLLVFLHTRRAPPDAEWRQIVDSAQGRTSRSMLVLTDGGNPTSQQRAMVQTRVMQDKPTTAVVSEAATIRFVVTSLMFFNENVRSFAPAGLDDALAWLQLSQDTATEARRTLRRLAKDPGGDRFETLQRAVAALKRG